MARRTLRFVGPREVDIAETELPEPGDNEVVVDTELSAISAGTELLVYRGEAPTDLPADATIDALDGDLSYPLTYGYAAVGTVVDRGPGVDASWQGRRVFAFHPHETAFPADTDALVPVPDLPPAAAALLPTVETATNLVLDARPRVGEAAVVFGAGLVGLCTTHLLAGFPLASLTVVEPLAERRAVAEEFGADRAVSPATFERPGNERGPPGADLVVELSGRPATLDDAVDAAGYDGRVLVGSWYGTKRADLGLGGRFHRNRVSVESSQVSTIAPDLRGRWTTDRRLETALDRLRGIAVDSLVSHRVPFEDAQRAYQLLDTDAPEALGVLLTYT